MPKSGGAAAVLASGLYDPVEVVSDGSDLFVAGYNNGFGGAGRGGVTKVPLDGGLARDLHSG